MSKVIGNALVCGALVFCSCAMEQNRAARVESKPACHIYMFRGLIDFVAMGLDAYARDLRARGFNAKSYSDFRGHMVATKIESEHLTGGSRDRIVLIGYSSGAVTAVAIAKQLNDWSIPVDLLVTLDPAVSETIPPNVRQCVNYYERIIPGVVLFSGTLMRPEPPAKVENIRLRDANHFNVDESPEMKAAITARIVALCAKS